MPLTPNESPVIRLRALGMTGVFPRLIAAVSTLAAVIAIMGTWRVYSGTFDEPAHVAAGMEFLDRGRYTYEPMHPPLARVAVALGPYLKGLRSYGSETMWREGRNILYANSAYRQNLAAARAGVLPFFLLATLMVWMWTRHVGGEWAAAAAVGLFVTTQPVLAHAGLATLDMPLVATCTAALFAFTLCLESPSRARSLWLGAAAGAALVTKFSSIVFLPAAAAAILFARLPERRRLPASARPPPWSGPRMDSR